MEEPSQAQPSMGPVGTNNIPTTATTTPNAPTSLPMASTAPLRHDSLEHAKSSGKMVSLADLHVNSPPVTPRETTDMQVRYLEIRSCMDFLSLLIVSLCFLLENY